MKVNALISILLAPIDTCSPRNARVTCIYDEILHVHFMIYDEYCDVMIRNVRFQNGWRNRHSAVG